MAKLRPEYTIISYGIYTKWEEESKSLPKIKSFTLDIPAQVDIEFGFIINIKRAKNQKLYYCIDHPKIPDENGIPLLPFTGEVYIKNNNWDFFLGDTIWEPISDKIGCWTLSLELDNKVIAKKSFNIIDTNLLVLDKNSF